MSSVALFGTPVRVSSRPAAPRPRSALVVHASADRRRVLSGLVGGIAMIPAVAAMAVERIRVDDSRIHKSAFDMFDEAADPEEDIRTRRGELQYRGSVDDTKARVRVSRQELEGVKNELSKGYWTASQNQLRNQTGYLRYDLENLVNRATNRGVAQEKKRAFFAQVDQLDLAIRNKNMQRAMDAYGRVLNSLDSVMGEVGIA